MRPLLEKKHRLALISSGVIALVAGLAVFGGYLEGSRTLAVAMLVIAVTSVALARLGGKGANANDN